MRCIQYFFQTWTRLSLSNINIPNVTAAVQDCFTFVCGYKQSSQFEKLLDKYNLDYWGGFAECRDVYNLYVMCHMQKYCVDIVFFT